MWAMSSDLNSPVKLPKQKELTVDKENSDP